MRCDEVSRGNAVYSIASMSGSKGGKVRGCRSRRPIVHGTAADMTRPRHRNPSPPDRLVAARPRQRTPRANSGSPARPAALLSRTVARLHARAARPDPGTGRHGQVPGGGNACPHRTPSGLTPLPRSANDHTGVRSATAAVPKHPGVDLDTVSASSYPPSACPKPTAPAGRRTEPVEQPADDPGPTLP